MRICIILLIVLMLPAGCSSAPVSTAASGQAEALAAPADLDLSTSRTSQQGLFNVSYRSDLDPVAINQLHTWTLHVETAGGQPLDGATVTVDGGMPAHNHGLPTQPLVTPLGGGDYRVEGMKFQMPGYWTVTVAVDAAGQEDTATFHLLLD